GVLAWMRGHGVRFQPMYTAHVNGVPSFSGVPTVDVWGGGEGLVDALADEAERLGVEIQYDSELVGVVRGDDGIEAVEIRTAGRTAVHRADGVVLAAGGFSANREW